MKYPCHKIFIVLLALYFPAVPLFSAANTTLKMLSTLPKGGYGFLERMRNDTKYPCDIYFNKDRSEDFLPELTTFRIKSLSEGKYFSYRQQPDNTFTCKADAADASDPNTLFVIRKGISPDLTPRIAISPYGDSKVFLTYDAESKLLKFTATDFVPEENQQCHWEIVSPYPDAPNKMDKVHLRNRLSGGCLTTFRGQETIKLEPDTVKEEKIDSLWGISLTDKNIAFGDEIMIKSLQNPDNYLKVNNANEFAHLTSDSKDSKNIWKFMKWKNRVPKDPLYLSFGDFIALLHNDTDRILNITSRDHNWDSYANRYKFEVASSRSDIDARDWNCDKDWLQNICVYDANGTELGKRIINDADIVTLRFNSPDRPGVRFPHLSVGPEGLASEEGIGWGGNGARFYLCRKNHGGFLAKYTFNADRTSGTWQTLQQRREPAFVQLSAKDNNDAWAVTKEGALLHWDGKNWTEEKLGAPQQHVSIADDGTVCTVGVDKILRTKTPKGWIEIDGSHKWSKVCVRNKDEIWGIDPEEKQIYKLSNQQTRAPQFLPGTAIDVSVASNGTVWAINATNQAFRFEENDWLLVPGLKLKQVSVQNAAEVWGVSIDDYPYRWNGTSWIKMSDDKFSQVFISSGSLKTIIPGRTETKTAEGASTMSSDGKQQGTTKAAEVAIEVEKLGMGGGLGPQTTSDYVAIPIKKKPKVAGFAETQFDGFSKSPTLNLTPLLSKGVAWLGTSIPAGRATISFMALAGDTGGVEVVFGQEISTNFIWKIRIGGWNNAKSGIIKRTIVDNVPKETLVAQTLPKEDPTNTLIPSNPLARVLPGQLMAYWVTIDNGLILVGTGDPGENIFLSWRDPNPTDNVNRVGISSDTKPVEYANVQLQAPLVIERQTRAYATIGGTITPTKSVTWTKHLFRVNDRATLSMDIQGEKQVAVALGVDENPANGNLYQVVFGYGNNEGIMIQKWFADEKRLKTIASVTSETYPRIKLDPSKPTSFWVSYEYGQIMVGQGAVGQNLILCIKDFAPFENIRSIGFASLESKSASITNLKLYPPTSLILEKTSQAYKTPSQQTNFVGDMTIIFPFEYQFSQLDQSIKMEDLVNHLSFYVGATPQQGTLYNFMLTIDKAGTPLLDLTVAPDTERLKEVQLSLLQGQKEIALKKAEADALSKSGTLQRMAMEAQGALDRTKSSASLQTATFIQQTGTGLATAAAMGMGMNATQNLAAMIAYGAATGIALSASIPASTAQEMLENAGKKELTGAEAQIAAEKLATAKAQDAERASTQQQLVEGQASFNFRSADSYVFIDKADRQALGTLTVKPEAQQSYEEVQALLASLRQPTMDEFAAYISVLHKVILNINYFKVVEAKATRDLIYSYIQTMYLAYTKQFFADPSTRPPAINSEIVNILIGAYNNTFLINQANSNEAVIKKTWNTWINELARDYITQPNFDFDLEPMFGEYIWHPQPIINNKVTLTFQAKANNDIFICFSPVNNAVRNTSTELYEVVLGGWDDTKSVVRIKSLDRSAKEVFTDDLLNSLDYKTYCLTYDNGKIKVRNGDNPNDEKSVFLSWEDPYPSTTNPMKYIGFSCWNSPITLKNINISDASGKLKPITTPKTVQSEEQSAPQEDLPIDQTQLPMDATIKEADLGPQTTGDAAEAASDLDQSSLEDYMIEPASDLDLVPQEEQVAPAVPEQLTLPAPTTAIVAQPLPVVVKPIRKIVPPAETVKKKVAPKKPKKKVVPQRAKQKTPQEITKKRPVPQKAEEAQTAIY
ncbi:MAG: tectonin domain-containing protein [Candidatus Babeliales bacterium]